MNTTNIVSTPNITGNIGSCQTSAVQVETGRSTWKKETMTITTNACTGEVQQFSSWEYTGLFWAGPVFIFMVLGIIWSVVSS